MTMKMIDLGFIVNMINCRRPQLLRQRGCKHLMCFSQYLFVMVSHLGPWQ